MAIEADMSGALDQVKTYKEAYEGHVNSTTDWKGKSHDELTTKAIDVSQKYISGIESGVDSFNSAVKKFLEYQECETKIKSKQQSLNDLTKTYNALDDTNYQQKAILKSRINSTKAKIEGFENKRDKLKNEIQDLLASVKEVKSEASNLNVSFTFASIGNDMGGGQATNNLLKLSGSFNYNGSSSILNILLGDLGKSRNSFPGLGFHPDNPGWCADYVSHVLQEAGYNFTPSAGCSTLRANLESAGFVMHYDSNYVAQPGDVVFYDWGHTGFVASDNGDGSTFTAIEGNTTGTPTDGYSGNCVAQKDNRSYSNVIAFATPVKNVK